MYVQPQRRGVGLGRRLLGLALDCAAGWVGVEQITLAVTTRNVAAQALYRSAGFVEYGVAPRALCVAGSYHDESLLVKHLGAA